MRRFPLSFLAALTVLAVLASGASAKPFAPKRGTIWHGVSGGHSVEQYSRQVQRRPDVFQLFTVWGNVDWTFKRADASGARMMLHLSTNRGPGTRERITPAEIAAGEGDAFLVRFGRKIADRGEPFYLRLFAEMNGPWNAYCAFDANGRRRPGHSTRQFRRAWRRIALILRGGSRETVDRKLRRLGMRGVQAGAGDLARAPVALMFVPHNAVALNIAANSPRKYWPGGRYVDWVGTDFYGQNPNWGALDRIYRMFPRKPFVFGEWALWGSDSPSFVRRLFSWARRHKRTRMMIYNEGARSNGPFQLRRYPRSKRTLRALLRGF